MSASEADPAPRAQLFRFLAVGGGAALLLWVLLFCMAFTPLPPFFGSVLAYAAAFAVAYNAQRSWTFAGKPAHSRALPRYFILQLGCALLSGAMSHLLLEGMGMSPLAMSALTTVIVSAVSYVASSRWVFASR